MPLEVIGIGSSVFDMLMTVDGFPQEDTKMQAGGTVVQGGGPCATALSAIATLGVSAAYMATLGDDTYGRFMADDLARHGVDTRLVTFLPGVSFHAVVLLNAQTASRTCVWSRGTVPPLDPDQVDADAIRHAKVLHLDGHQLPAALRAASIARAAGVKVSLDAGGLYAGIEKLLPLVDWLIPSEEFALKLTGAATAEDAAREIAARYSPETLIVTQGVRGGFLFRDGMPERYPAFPVAVVDSNGSGDVFHGAFVAGKARGFSDRDACVFASGVAAKKCTHLGARDGVPSFADALAFLRERGAILRQPQP